MSEEVKVGGTEGGVEAKNGRNKKKENSSIKMYLC